MESFDVSMPSAACGRAPRILLCGVVSSGNLEVLVEAQPRAALCEVSVCTSAVGFRAIWDAVLRDFAQRNAAGGLRLSINDAGATPAVVSLRLDQAYEGAVAPK